MVVKRLRKEDRRVQLLEVARGIVRQQGTEALTLGYLAERANVTKPIPYDHFGDREGLLMALYQDYSDRQLAKFRETLAVDSKTLEKTIRFFSAAYIRLRHYRRPGNGSDSRCAVRLPRVADVPRGVRCRMCRLSSHGAFSVYRA